MEDTKHDNPEQPQHEDQPEKHHGMPWQHHQKPHHQPEEQQQTPRHQPVDDIQSPPPSPLQDTLAAAADKAFAAPVHTPPQLNVMQPQQTAKRGGLLKRMTSKTRAYLAEYAVMLLVLGSMIGIVNILFGGIIDSFSDPKNDWYNTGSFAYKVSIGYLAAIVALIPVLLLLTKRTSGTEEDAPAVKTSSWRKAFLGIFLIGLGISAITSTVSFIYTLVSYISNMGLAVDSDSTLWQSLVKAGFGAILFGLSALLYARDYRPLAEGNMVMWRRVHRYGLVLVAVALAAVFVAGPLQKHRNAYVDSLVSGDLEIIISKVKSHAREKGQLPKDLASVDLSEHVKKRSQSLKYEYKPSGSSFEICATFKTDTTESKDNSIVTALSGMSSSNEYYDSMQSPSKHKKGNQCFKESTGGSKVQVGNGNGSGPATSIIDNLYDDDELDDLDDTYDDFDLDDENDF